MSLLTTASLVVTPNTGEEGTLFSIVPDTGLGDLSVTRATTATRVNSQGLVESMGNNVPRLDYSNGTCPSVLVEPQRTNIMVNSSSFSSAGWLSPDTTITANTTNSPSGIQDADTIAFTTGLGGYVGQGYTHSGVHTFSVYAKYIGTQWLYLQNYNGGDFGAWFNIQNGTIGTTESGVTASIEQAENGFYRCTITYNASISNASYYVFFNTTGNGSYARTGSSYFWGAQLEAGSYATSYIPTTSASVTRNADVISKTGISSLIGQTEGTIFAEFIHNGANITTTQSYFTISSGNNNNIITIGTYTNRINPTVRASNVSIFDVFAGPNPLTEGVHKIAIGYKSGDFAIYLDGASILTSAASATFGTMGQLDLGNSLSNNWQLGDGIKATALWKTRLTNDQLATLTTL